MNPLFGLIVIALILIFFVSSGIRIYNRLIMVNQNVDKAFANIDVLLKQRADEMPGSVHYETSYIRQGSGPLQKQQIIICTGIRGVLYMKVKIEKNDKKGEKDSTWEIKKGKKRNQNDKTPLLEKPAGEYTELLKGFKIPFDPEPVFDESLKKYFN